MLSEDDKNGADKIGALSPNFSSDAGPCEKGVVATNHYPLSDNARRCIPALPAFLPQVR